MAHCCVVCNCSNLIMASAPCDPNLGPPPPNYNDVLQRDNFGQYHQDIGLPHHHSSHHLPPINQTQLHPLPLPITTPQPNQPIPEMVRRFKMMHKIGIIIIIIIIHSMMLLSMKHTTHR